MTASSTSEFRHIEISINGEDCVVALAIEDEQTVVAVGNAASLVTAQGGFRAVIDPPEMIAQVQLVDVPDEWQAVEDILASSEWLIQTVDILRPDLVHAGGGARAVRARTLAPGRVAVAIVVDCCQSTSANIVNEIAEYLAPTLRDMTGARLAIRILTNVADTRLIRVHGRVRPEQLGTELDADEMLEHMAAMCEFADFDAGRAATLNKSILQTVGAVILASGNDWRAVEAGAHAYAARKGGYRPLARWAIDDDGSLVGELTMPVSLGAVETEIAEELAAMAGSIGLATNFATLWALAAEGVERTGERRRTTERPACLGPRKNPRARSNKGLPAPRQDTTRPFVRAG